MHWFGGNIAEAVALTKQNNAIFVVFVEGEDEQSHELAQTLDNAEVESRLGDEASFLAVKLKSGSETYVQFARIYQLVPVPSVFFIGRSGAPLEVVCAGVTPDMLATRIDRILHTHRSDVAPAPSGFNQPTSAQYMRAQTSTLLQSEAAAASTSGEIKGPGIKRPSTEDLSKPHDSKPISGKPTDKGYDVVCDGDVCFKRPKTDLAGPSGTSTNKAPEAATKEAEPASEQGLSEEEKIERAKALIEARRRETAQKEKELEKQRELERRNTGKSVAELKRWQAEQELKQIQEERKREKMENNLARQRILEQIAQDRAERKARDVPPPAQPQPAAPTITQPATTSSGGDTMGRARIQFKLPDGQSHTAHFQAADTLATVRQYIANNLQLNQSQFSLWTAFPRRELTDETATLSGLQLAPSAALLVMRTRQANAALAQPTMISAAVAFFTQLFSRFVVYPCQCTVGWVRSAVWGDAPSPGARGGGAGTGAGVALGRPPATLGPFDDGVRRRITNIHRLSPERNPDDDNNTWNGNSTQQM